MNDSRKNATTRLRHRLTLQQEVKTADGAGGYSRSWTNIADLWAEISPISNRVIYGEEKLYAGHIEARISHKITIRYRSGLSTAMRLLFESRVFNIRAISFVNEDKDLVELLVEEGVAA